MTQMQTLRKLWIFTRLELLQVARERSSLVWMLAVPLIFTWVFGLAFRDTGSRNVQIGLAVADRDGSELASRLVRALESEGFAVQPVGPVAAAPLGAGVAPSAPGEADSGVPPESGGVAETGPEPARNPAAGAPAASSSDPAAAAGRGAEEGAAAPSPAAPRKVRTLTIPAGFSRALLAGEKTELLLEEGDRANPMAAMAAKVNVYKAVIRLMANLAEMDVLGRTWEPRALVAEYDRLDARPPVVVVEVSRAGRGRETPSGYAQTVPGNLVMFVLMSVLLYGGVAMALEKRRGLLRRTATTPTSRAAIFAGKLAGRVAVGLLQVAIMLLAGTLLFRLYWGESRAALLLVILSYTLCIGSLGVLFGALVRTVEQATGIGVIATLVMASLGGCWWSLEIVPRWLRLAGHLFPTAWAMDGLHQVISFGHGAAAVLPHTALLLAYALLFLLLGARFFRYD